MTPYLTIASFWCFSIWFITVVQSWNNNLTLTPPMGWANWNTFGCNYTDETIRTQSQLLVSLGLRDLGYKIVIIQECIGIGRDENGTLIVDPVKFPYGMKSLVDFIHSNGLLAGIYTDVGSETCANFVGSFNYENIDAMTFANWGIDFIEEDACHKPDNYSYEQLYTRMHDAIQFTQRNIIFYVCVWGKGDVQNWGKDIGNIWRTTGDICSPGHATYEQMINNFYANAKYPNNTGPMHWQDPDMMVVGMSGLTDIEWKTHFSLWCISAAPLWIGIDLTVVDSYALQILKNEEVIDVDQDILGYMAVQINGTTDYASDGEVWYKTLQPKISENETSAVAVVLFNPSDINANVSVIFSDIAGMDGMVNVRDLWAHKDLGQMETYNVQLSAHAVSMLRIVK